MELKFIYGDMPFWRAEVGRLSLFLGDIEFEDIRINRAEFSRVKERGRLDDGTIIPFNQIPCLVVDGVSIAQTAGIARFCGKLSGLYPKSDDIRAAQIDQFLDFATDINFLVSSTNVEQNHEERTLARQELVKGALGRKLTILENCLSEGTKYIVLQNMSIADIAIWRLMGWLSSGVLDGVPIEILEKYPKIRGICLTVDHNPKVQEWIKLTFPENYSRGNF